MRRTAQRDLIIKLYYSFIKSNCILKVILVLYLTILGGTCAYAQEDLVAEPVVVQTFTLKHANVRQLEPVIQPLLSLTGTLSTDLRTNSLIVQDMKPYVETVKKTIKKLDSKMPSHTFRLNYANAENMAERIRNVLGPATRIVEPDNRTHTVHVRTLPSEMDIVKKLIDDWDRPMRQVLIEADILDVSSAKLKELGVEWELRLGYDGNSKEVVFNHLAGRETTERGATGKISVGSPSITIPAVLDIDGNVITPAQVIPGSDFSATIEALIEDSSTRTLSRPRILVLDGYSARFNVTDREPYADIGGHDYDDDSLELNIKFLDVGIVLDVTPQINDDDYVTMEIRTKVSSVVGEEFFDTTIIPDEGGAITNTIRVPVESESVADTKVTIRDNQTIALGGLGSRMNVDSVKKVPLLGDIPILGIPFRNINQGHDERELVIFITPHLVASDVSSPEAILLNDEEIIGGGTNRGP